MGRTLLDVMPLALAVSLSPTAITAVIFLLMTPRPTRNAAAMAAGWSVSLSLVVVVAYLFGSATGIADRGIGDGDKIDVLRLVLGSLLVLASALAMVRRRRGTGSRQPKWMESLDSFTPRRSFILGIAMADVKNLILAFAAVSGIVYGSHELVVRTVVLVVFVAVGSVGVTWPLVAHAVGGDEGDESLRHLRDWLVANGAKLTAVMLLVFGIALLGQGLAGLLD